MTNDEKREAISNIRLVCCLFCGVGKDCNTCEAQKTIEEIAKEETHED